MDVAESLRLSVDIGQSTKLIVKRLSRVAAGRAENQFDQTYRWINGLYRRDFISDPDELVAWRPIEVVRSAI